ncbi:N-glycosylase/DNA lyase [Marchantia polymorpha subsp. ruderalis]
MRLVVCELHRCAMAMIVVKRSCTPPGSPHISERPIPTRTSTSRRKLFGRSIVSAVKEENRWRSLGVSTVELNLPLTVVTGQTFRWRSTGASQYTGVVGSHLISLRQCREAISFLVHTPDEHDNAEAELRDYLNMDTSLEKLYADFNLADVRFAAVSPYLTGARLLRQNPVECLFQFICSSNNHISRISGMVEFLASKGCHLGTVEGLDFHAFPSLEQLASLTEAQLRDAGFGYRAKYVVGATEALLSKEGGGEEWLLSLRQLPLEEVVKSLCTLPGVGPKVAACIALFSMDQHHAIPVDTHVWQIAVRYLLPELADRSLTLKAHQEVQDAFVKRFGTYAGWAHTVLFISELSSQQNLLPQHLRSPKKQNVKSKRKVKALLLEAESGDEQKVKSKRKVKALFTERVAVE